MFVIARYQKHIIFACVFADDLMDFHHIRAGRIHISDPKLVEPLPCLHRNPVRSDDNGAVLVGFVGAVDNPNALFLKIVDHLRIMDNRSQGADLFSPFGQLFQYLDRPVYTEAKAGGFCNFNRHIPSPTFSVYDLFSKGLRFHS